MTNYSRSVLKSNGLHRPKIRLKKFGFSLKTVPATIAKKLPPQRCFKPLFIASFNFSHKRRNVRFKGLRRVHTPPHPRFAHTAAYTPKQGPSLPRPQHSLELPAESPLFRHAFIYIHFPVLCEPPRSAVGEKPAKLPPQRCSKPLVIAFFNFSHKRPTFAFTGESGYTLAFAQRIAHNGSHGETGVFRMGGAITTLRPFCVVRKPCVAGT